MEMFISFFTGKVMLFFGISLIMKEKSNASALSRPPFALLAAEGSATGGRESMTSYWERREL